MSLISVLLLAAGAIAANVPSSGNYNQLQGTNQGGSLQGKNGQYIYEYLSQQNSGKQQYGASEYGNNEDSHVPENYYGEEVAYGNSQQNVPGSYSKNVQRNRNAKFQYLNKSGYNRNSGYNSDSSYMTNPGSYSKGVNQGSYPSDYEQNEYNQSPYPENKRNGHPGVGVYGQGGYASDNQNVQQNDYVQSYRYNPDSSKVQPEVGSIKEDFGLSELSEDDLRELKLFAEPIFALYTRNSPRPESYQFEDAVKILKSKTFDNKKKTMVYIHGFTEGLFAESVKHVVATYLAKNDHNVLILDWHWYSAPPYLMNAVPNVQKVGVRAGVALLEMINSGLNLQRLHVVGHSLGGQMAGVIGRTIKKESKGGVSLRRISALDPAFPGFYGIPNVVHLTKNDADYVDVLHTDVGVYGAPISTGTVDFWPNSGLPPQPGCWNNVCSHQRSWWYWSDSLTDNTENYFNAVKANSWEDFVNGKVDDFVPDITMGISCPAGLYGNYYLRTKDADPFGEGENGIKLGQALINAILPPTPLLDSEPPVDL